MWKDWLFFSKSQRIGILFLAILILLLVAGRILMPHFNFPNNTKPDLFESEAQLFLDSLKSVPPDYYHRQYSHYNNGQKEFGNKALALPAPILFQFNPNTADSVQFVRLGIKPKITSNILKYRSKGGKFRYPEDFRKIWGISPADADRIIPYIDIPEEAKNSAPTTIAAANRIQKTNVIIELNSADTTQLQQVKGIGSGFARRIIAYRQRLGGFVKVEQLKEVWGMTPEMYDNIHAQFIVDAKLTQPINVNKAGIEKLKSHPYLNFYTAKAIYELRLAKKSLKSINDLKQLEALNPVLIEKLEPYLSF